jgi:hypothetical protein
MTTDPIDIVSGAPMSEWIATMPDSLSDIPIGMWHLVPRAKSFGLEGEARVDFIRRCNSRRCAMIFRCSAQARRKGTSSNEQWKECSEVQSLDGGCNDPINGESGHVAAEL